MAIIRSNQIKKKWLKINYNLWLEMAQIPIETILIKEQRPDMHTWGESEKMIGNFCITNFLYSWNWFFACSRQKRFKPEKLCKRKM